MSAKVVLIDNGLPIELAESQNQFGYVLLPVGKFYDKRYGKLNITEKLVNELADNFGKEPAYEVPVKLGHGDGAPSPGKVTKVEATSDGLKIFMDVDADTAKAIRDRQYRYMSAEFDSAYVDKKTGKKVGAVLLGAALVNQPANPYMAPLVLADDLGGKEEMTNEELEKALKAAQDEAAKARAELADTKKAFEDESAKSAKELDDLKAEYKRLADEKAKADRAKREADVKAFCDGWKSKGIPPAAMDKLAPYLMNESNVIRLSDSDEKPAELMTVLDEVFEVMPRVSMGQTGISNADSNDTDDAVKLGEDIAKCINVKQN